MSEGEMKLFKDGMKENVYTTIHFAAFLIIYYLSVWLWPNTNIIFVAVCYLLFHFLQDATVMLLTKMGDRTP